MRVHNRRRISTQKYTTLFNCFVADVASSKASEITHVNRKTADRYYPYFVRQSPPMHSENEKKRIW